MRNLPLLIFPLLILSLTSLNAQETVHSQKGELSSADNHTGKVWLKELVKPDSVFNFSMAIATFEAGAKLDWHIHPGGQVLLITDGVGYYQERGKPLQQVYAGDKVKCDPGIEHWHGASPSTGVTYLAISPAQNGKTIWKSRVSDDAYHAIKEAIFDSTAIKQELIDLSKKKWLWMAEKNTDSLNLLFCEKAYFVHIGGSWGKEPELNVIKTGGIWYKNAEIQETSVQIMGNTAILLSKIRLTAEVGGNVVVNPFIVTEVYVKELNLWKLGSLSFTKQL